eukprot:Gb_02990 [translate_table: standard]
MSPATFLPACSVPISVWCGLRPSDPTVSSKVSTPPTNKQSNGVETNAPSLRITPKSTSRAIDWIKGFTGGFDFIQDASGFLYQENILGVSALRKASKTNSTKFPYTLGFESLHYFISDKGFNNSCMAFDIII